MENFADILFRNPAADEKVALVEDNGRATYGDLRRHVGGLASGLTGLGVTPGDRVAILLGNRIAFVESYLAIVAAGAVAVPLNTRLTPVEHGLLLQDAEPKALITDAAGMETAWLARASVPTLRTVIALDEAEPADVPFEELIAAPSRTAAPMQRARDDVALILYTSGTTSGPKGAMITHGNLLADLGHSQGFLRLTPAGVNLQLSPLYHAAGVFTYLHLRAGGTTVFLSKPTPEAILEAIERHRATFMFTVPTLLYALLDCPDRHRRDLSSLETLQYGAAAITGPRLDEAISAFGQRLVHSFGMTESTSSCSILGKAEHRTRPGSIGRPLDGVEMRIVDEAGSPLGPDAIGEIEIRGAHVMKGYWRKPEATAAVLREGWLASGDLGRRDAEGYYYIAGRKKDLIISGGVNIYPGDIENVLAEHPGVAEVAVYGAPDPKWGECVVAAVVAREGVTLDPDELRDFVRETLGAFKAPKIVRLLAALPKGGTGKVLKRELRAAAEREGLLAEASRASP